MEGRSIAVSGRKPLIEWAATVVEVLMAELAISRRHASTRRSPRRKRQWTENVNLAMDIGDPDSDGRRKEEREGWTEIRRTTSSVIGFSWIELRSLGLERSVQYNGGLRTIWQLLRRPSRVTARGFVGFLVEFCFLHIL
ncbi:hypothetical protein TIFTF001_006121 [Ficus carica]|uniref:Uncharacterized protein n=1 Tax=Ficus carica TaxID=3494 RepID=A0AA87ZMA1_FICCA|nr:hypothetical protein TIFTF001_006121 [Ficus carica]